MASTLYQSIFETGEARGEARGKATLCSDSLLLARVAGKAQIATLRVAVNFYTGEHLLGIDPATGEAAPVPAQSLLFTRFNGAVHVFLWTPEATSTAGKRNFVRVYKPAPGDAWEEVGSCWVDERKLARAQLTGSIPPVDCSSPDFWLK